MRLAGAGLLVFLGSWLSACWVPMETGRQMQVDLTALSQAQAGSAKGLDLQRARLDEQITKADAKIAEVASTLDELNRAARSTDADFGVQIERLINEVQELRGTIELTEYRLGKIEAKLEGDGSLDARLGALEKGARAPGEGKQDKPDKNDGPKGAESSAKETASPPKGKKELLAYAQGLLKDGKINDARGVYRDVIKQWPSEVGVTDEAYFRIGDSYYEEKKCRSALQEYIKVVEKFSSGVFADDAYMRIGMCSIEIGNLEDAKIFFTEIVKNYKKSPLAKQAQAKLDDVNSRLEKEAKKKK